MTRRFHIETLGCPKNQVDSDKLAGTLSAAGYEPAASAESADLVVVNTCAFIEASRAESIETILDLAHRRGEGSRLVVTGCLAQRAGAELAEALPEVDLVAGFGVPVALERRPARRHVPGPGAGAPAGGDRFGATAPFDLLELARPAASAPWAYVKVAEGCDRRCGFCAIPSFRGRQRSRRAESVLAEVDALGCREIVLVAQDLASYGRDLGQPGALAPLVEAVAARTDRVRLLYLYPSSLTDVLIDTIAATGVSYYDLSLQHASARLLRSMRRPGGTARFLERIARIRAVAPEAALRSSFILGYPGENEEDHDELLAFLDAAQLDWAGFFTFSPEEGTYAADLCDTVPQGLATERLRECAELQDAITARRRRALVGSSVEVLVDAPGRARSFREAPEIDGVVRVPDDLAVGCFTTVGIVDAEGPDLVGVPVTVSVGSGTVR